MNGMREWTNERFNESIHPINHWSYTLYVLVMIVLLQGLYPESHGIIANKFYSPELGETFSFGGRNLSDNRWWSGEPVCWLLWPCSSTWSYRSERSVRARCLLRQIRSDALYFYFIFGFSDPVDVVIANWQTGDETTTRAQWRRQLNE